MLDPIVSNPDSSNEQFKPGIVYLASGHVGDTKLMKVGEAANTSRRQKHLAIAIEHECIMPSQAEAFRGERQLRAKMRELGAEQHGATYDWFVFDAWVYERVRAEMDTFQRDPLIRLLNLHAQLVGHNARIAAIETELLIRKRDHDLFMEASQREMFSLRCEIKIAQIDYRNELKRIINLVHNDPPLREES